MNDYTDFNKLLNNKYKIYQAQYNYNTNKVDPILIGYYDYIPMQMSRDLNIHDYNLKIINYVLEESMLENQYWKILGVYVKKDNQEYELNLSYNKNDEKIYIIREQNDESNIIKNIEKLKYGENIVYILIEEIIND